MVLVGVADTPPFVVVCAIFVFVFCVFDATRIDLVFDLFRRHATICCYMFLVVELFMIRARFLDCADIVSTVDLNR